MLLQLMALHIYMVHVTKTWAPALKSSDILYRQSCVSSKGHFSLKKKKKIHYQQLLKKKKKIDKFTPSKAVIGHLIKELAEPQISVVSSHKSKIAVNS